MGNSKKKTIFFLVGLPRAGNTLLGSILNQNPDIAVTANSITPELLVNVSRIPELNVLQNFPDYKSFNNVAHHVFDLYYRDWNCKYIIDRSPWGTPNNLKILKEIQKDIKIIVLVRDIIEVLASFVRWSHNRTDTFLSFTDFKPKTVEEKCDYLMKDGTGLVAMNLIAIKELLLPQNKDLCHFVEYNDLVGHPRKTIEKIYNFLQIPEFKHRYVNLDQFEVNGMKYDDTVFGEGLHTIKTDNINKSNYNAYNLIPKTIIEKYKHFNLWNDIKT